MTEPLCSDALAALKEALCAAYWYKGDLRGFLEESLCDPSLLAELDWEGYRSQIVSDLVERLLRRQDERPGELARLCRDLCSFTTLVHLDHLDDADPKAKRARTAIARLKSFIETRSDKA